MAKFSQTFLQSMLQPSYQEGLFTAARGIGAAPQMRALQQQQQAELSRYDESTKLSEQGVAAAQQGDVSALTQRIADLRRQMATATTLQEKQAIRQEMNNLQRMRPGAEKIAVGNKAQSIVQGEQALKDETVSGPAKLAIQKRLEELKKDPEAMRQYNQYKMDEWRTGQAQKQMESEQWLVDNAKNIDEAIQNDDIEEVQRIILNAGEFSNAAQSYVNTSLRNAETLIKFEENSIERKKAPSVNYYKQQLEALPEELRKGLKPTLQAYEEISKDWNGETWTVSGARARASQLEKKLQSEISAINRSVAIADYRISESEAAEKRERIKNLEIKINTPMTSDYLTQGRIYASSLLGKKEQLTPEMINQAANLLYQRDRQSAISQLEALQGESVDEGALTNDGGFSVNVGGIVTTRTMVQESIEQQGVEATKSLLTGIGLNDDQIKALIGVDMSQSAPTQEDLITRSGLINPARARLKLQQGLPQ